MVMQNISSRRQPPTLTCGQAGDLTEKLEDLLGKKELMDVYQENLKNLILDLHGLDSSDRLGLATVYSFLHYQPQHITTRIRFQTALSTLIENRQETDVYSHASFMPYRVSSLRDASVREVSTRQFCKDFFNKFGFSGNEKAAEAKSRLQGMLHIAGTRRDYKKKYDALPF